MKISRNNDHAKGTLLHYLYHQNYYKLFGISFNLSSQTNMTISQQTNFTGKLKEDDGVKRFLLLKSSKKLLSTVL